MIDAVGASPHDMLFGAMLERALLAPGHGCMSAVGLLPQGNGGRQRWYAIPAVLDARRTNAIDRDGLPGFHSWGAEAALSLFARELAAPL